MEPVGALEKEAPVGRDRGVLSEQVLEHRGLDAHRGVSPGDLCELLWVPNENQVARGSPIASASASETWPASS